MVHFTSDIHRISKIGYSQNIEDRLWEHNIGRIGYSSKRRPWELIYKEEYASSTEALKREKYLKS